MTWAEEVAQGEAEARAELLSFERDLVQDVLVEATEGFGSADQPTWGCFYPEFRRIEVHRGPFDEMPDPEHRRIQIKDVVYHELRHALGEVSPDHFPTMTEDYGKEAWLSGEPMDLATDGLVIHLPADVLV